MLELGRSFVIAVVGIALQLGCRDNTPPVPMVPPAAPGQDSLRREYEPDKPMPGQEGRLPEPFIDEPLLVDSPPEAKRFVTTYEAVGRPNIMVYVNRTLYGPTAGPVENDGIGARPIDFELMETLLTDWLAADGKVAIVSPDAARRTLTAEQDRAIESGRVELLQQVAGEAGADVLIRVQARLTRQTGVGQAVRIVAEAVNTKGDSSLARAAVDMYPPLDKGRMNKFTRFMARKLMDGMASTWSGPGPGGAKGAQPPPPQEKGAGPRLQPGEKPAAGQ